MMAPVIALILFALLLIWLSGRLRGASGVPEGALVYTDTGAWQRNEKPLFSRAHKLSGKPDYLVRDGDAIVPVEVKSARAPDQPRYGHVLQLAAYCLLVEESLGVRVERGILKYADRQFVIDYTPRCALSCSGRWTRCVPISWPAEVRAAIVTRAAVCAAACAMSATKD